MSGVSEVRIAIQDSTPLQAPPTAAPPEASSSWDCCNPISLIGRVAQYWQEGSLLAAAIYNVVQAIFALIAGNILGCVLSLACAGVLIYAAHSLLAVHMIDELNKALDKANNELSKVSRRLTDTTAQLEDVVNRNGVQAEKIRANVEQLQQKRDEIAKEIDRLNGSIARLEGQEQSMSNVVQKLERETSSLRQEREGLVEDMRKNREAQQSLHDTVSAAHAFAQGTLRGPSVQQFDLPGVQKAVPLYAGNNAGVVIA